MFPEAGGDILEGAIWASAVHPLIGAWGVEATKMAEIGTHFDIVETLLVDEWGDCCAPSVPANFQSFVVLSHVFSEPVDLSRVAIAPHKSHTCYRVFRFMNQCRQCLCRQVMSPIRPQELTMAARTVTRTTRHVDGKGHLIGELLKNNICIYIMKHFYLTLNDKTHSRSRGYIHPHNSVSHSIERTTIWPTKI